MKILLSYSRFHFDPAKKPEEQEYWGGSANVLARSLYALLSEMGEVTYIDPDEYPTVRGRSFDLFVGQVSNFKKILDACKIKKSIYFAVNMHPSDRNRIIKSYVRKEGLPTEAITPGDLVDAPTYRDSIAAATYLISIGNNVTYNSYVANGVPKTKIKMINYSVGDAIKDKDLPKSRSKIRQYLYLSSDIGLRKGFDAIVKIAEDLHSAHPGKFHLNIVGRESNSPYYQQKLRALLERYPKEVTYHGWAKTGSKKIEQLIRANDFTIFPSLEEAQAGSVLEALRYGVIPMISRNTCNDYSPLGWLDAEMPDHERRAIIDRSMQLTAEEVDALSRKTLEYYRMYHHPFLDSLRETLQGAIKDELYPKISLTLAIFNKEKTIKRLVRYMDGACRAYGNAEVHIIFDGCKDKTEAIVRDYFANRNDYPVTFEVTPDIFEIKTNNLGLKKSTGKYCVIIQDDNLVYDPNTFLEAIGFLEKNPSAAILGCLAGANMYPRGTILPEGPGAKMMSSEEVYWRQDAETDPELQNRVFEVDTVMRGPLIIRNDFLHKHGYLDEAYAPLYYDDMDIAYRVRKYGYRVFAMLSRVENARGTMALYDEAKGAFFERIIKKNTDFFYKRWTPSTEKDYSWINRVPIVTLPRERVVNSYWATADRIAEQTDSMKHLVRRAARKARSMARR